jgi:hypothetical protein
MSTSVQLDVERPASYQPVQLVIRLLVMILLAAVGAPLGWLFHALYLALPLVAAFAGPAFGERYPQDLGGPMVGALRWLLALYAYLGLLTDRLPIDEQHLGIRYDVACAGTPTIGGALLRWVTSIPALVVLWVLGAVSVVLWLIAAVAILVRRQVPDAIYDFQRHLLRLTGRFFAHHASLVPGMAPIRVDTGSDAGAVGPPVSAR